MKYLHVKADKRNQVSALILKKKLAANISQPSANASSGHDSACTSNEWAS